MSTSKRSRHDSEDDDVRSSEEELRGASHKAKKSKSVKHSRASNSGNEEYWELSTSARTPRRANISVFKNSCLVNIREYYENGQGVFLPGKKGISLTVEQYKQLLKAIPHINSKLRQMGEELDIPEGLRADLETEVGSQDASKTKSRSDRSNIDVTSDEDEN